MVVSPINLSPTRALTNIKIFSFVKLDLTTKTELPKILLSTSAKSDIPYFSTLNTDGEGLFHLHFGPTHGKRRIENDIKPFVYCKIFEDNNDSLDLAKSPKRKPRTKHIALKYHHFRKHVRKGVDSIHAMDTIMQLANFFTKPIPGPTFAFLRNGICGWWNYYYSLEGLTPILCVNLWE